MNKNITFKTIRGHRCAVVKSTCHTDEGAMNFGYNHGDDTAADTNRIGRNNYWNTIDKLFPGETWAIAKVTSCVEDKEWGNKHLPRKDMEEYPHCCFKVEAESFVMPQELCDEVVNRHGGPEEVYKYDDKRREMWEEFASLFKEATGHVLTHLPHLGLVTEFEKQWAKEHADPITK